MEINVPVEEMRKRRLFIATPMYGGQCAGMFTRSVADLSGLCTRYQIPMHLYFLFNESLVTRARNYCVDEFLRSGATHLMFIDSDIGFDPQDVLALLAISIQHPEYNVLCGPYPKKTIAWEKIKAAVDRGMADEKPSNLEKYVGDYVFNPTKGTSEIPIGKPCQVMEGGTGFMLIPRETLVEYDKHYPELKYRPDHVRTEAFDGSREIMAYFDCIIDPESKRYLSEDYMFCYNVQKAGMTVWMCPWMKLKHVGSYVFGGSLADLASIGASATADVRELKKSKKVK
jgi:hypothetical protein